MIAKNACANLGLVELAYAGKAHSPALFYLTSKGKEFLANYEV